MEGTANMSSSMPFYGLIRRSVLISIICLGFWTGICHRSPLERQASVIMLAVDSVEPASAKFKIYIRAYQVSISNICDMVTLGGRLGKP